MEVGGRSGLYLPGVGQLRSSGSSRLLVDAPARARTFIPSPIQRAVLSGRPLAQGPGSQPKASLSRDHVARSRCSVTWFGHLAGHVGQWPPEVSLPPLSSLHLSRSLERSRGQV
jgi:hypothetical protein